MTEASAVLTPAHRQGSPTGRRRAAIGGPTGLRRGDHASATKTTVSSRSAGPVRCAHGPATSCASTGTVRRRRPPRSSDGWYHSGDTGYVDEQGFLFIVDRLKDMIVTGGENVYSIEVENAISTHPAVAQVAVIGIPDDLWGEAVHAVVVLEPGTHATAEELTEHARQTIAGYKLPKSIEFRTDPLPLSGALKPLKRELRKPYWEGRERRV